MEYKRPDDTDHGHGHEVWKIENRAVQSPLPELGLVNHKSKDQCKCDRYDRDDQQQLKGVSQSLQKGFIGEQISIIFQTHKFWIQAQRGGIGKGKIERPDSRNDRKEQRQQQRRQNADADEADGHPAFSF